MKKKRTVKVLRTREQYTLYQRRPTGRLVPCPGEAHRAPGYLHIDNCTTCAPRWGEIEELEPVDLDAAKREGLAVMMNDVADEKVEDLIKAGGRLVDVEEKRKGNIVSFFVLVFR